jgi:hypothetical protein
MTDPGPSSRPPTKEELDALLAALSADDRVLVLQEFDRVVARPAETDLSSYGCLGSFVGLMLLVALPMVARSVTVPPAVRVGLMSVGVGLIVAGVLMRMLVPGKRVRDAGLRAKSAIDALATTDPAAGRSHWYGAAAAALNDAFYSGGPWTVHTFDFDQARKRLGNALPRVIAVETLLRLERGIYPVFTDFVSPPPESDRTPRS